MGWVLQDDNNGTVSVYETGQGDSETAYEKIIYRKKKVKFCLQFNAQHKTVGYRLQYEKEKKTPKFSEFNSFGIIYHTGKDTPVEDLKLNIIYEDQIIRFLAYEHNKRSEDYWLVGRWRVDSTEQEEMAAGDAE